MTAMKIGAHTFAWSAGITDTELAWLMPKLANQSIDFVELATYDLEGLSPQVVRKLSDLHELTVTLCSGLPRGLSLSSPAPSIRKHAQEHILKLLNFASECGAVKVSGPLHGDLSKPAVEASSYDDWQRLINSYIDLRPALQEAALPFSIEPLNRYQSSLINTLEQTDELCKTIDLPNVGILVDLFHANIEQNNLYRDLNNYRERTTHIHLCGANRGPIGTCHLDWEQLTTWLKTFEDGMMVSIETFDPSNPLIARRTRTWRSFEETSESIVLNGAKRLKTMIDE